MKFKKAIILFMIVYISILIVSLISGCEFFIEQDKKRVLRAYTDAESYEKYRYEKYYTFKAVIKDMIVYSDPDNKIFSLEVDYDYFEQLYGDDGTVLDGRKIWETDYEYFNSFRFMIVPSNIRILVENGGYDLLQEGTEVTITANSYYAWSGWEYPILSLTIDETTYLDFDTGLENFLAYVNAGFKDS